MFIVVAVTTAPVWTHDGRRFEVKVIDGQILAHGYNSGPDDGAPSPRPYFNAIHGHWENNASPAVTAAAADLPGYDVFAPGLLAGHDLTLTLLGASKWVNPPPMPPTDTVPTFEPLEVEETIFLTFDGSTIDSNGRGSLVLSPNVPGAGLRDIDLSYDIASRPAGLLYVLELQLSSSHPGMIDSETIYTILSPDGADPMERLHHASLFLESFLGAPVPEPASALLCGFAGLYLFLRSRFFGQGSKRRRIVF